MTSSGMKRGLATIAVSALAVTGLPALTGTAYSVPLSSDFTSADSVALVGPDGVGSTKFDGENSTITLMAAGGANITSVTFRYSTNLITPSWTNIATVSPDTNGAYSTEWAPDATGDILVEVLGRDAGGNIVDSSSSTVNVSSTDDSVNVSNAKGSALGVFQQPYGTDADSDTAADDLGIVRATTSDVTGASGIGFYGVTVNGADEYTTYGYTGVTEDDAAAEGATTRTTRGTIDFDTYDWGTATDDDQALVEAFRSGEDDSVETVDLYLQEITTVTAAAADNNIPTGGTTSITVTVLDQSGNPIAGAQVVDRDTPTYDKFTNTKGQVTFTGVSGSSSGTTHEYYVNVDDRDAYNDGDDFLVSDTVSTYTASAASMTPSSIDGSAFDRDEYASGDVTVTVKDQQSEPMAGQVVRYYWTIDPFDSTVADVTTTEQTATTNGSGVATVELPTGQPDGTYTLHSYVNKNGLPGQQAADLAGAPLVVKTGESDIVWADDPSAQRPSGTTQVFTGSLELADGTTLGGRNLDIDWTAAIGGNAVIANQAAQPAGTTRTSNIDADVVTRADGSFGVALSDPDPAPAGGEPSELDGTLLAQGLAGADEVGTDASESLDVDFLKNAAASTITFNDQDGVYVGNGNPLIDDKATPGRPVDYEFVVQNSDGDVLANRAVTLTTDHGFFTDQADTAAALNADPDAAEGGLYGEWNSLGSTITVTTDENGVAEFTLAIERDSGFDDNGLVTSVITATSGAATATQSLVWSSNDALNPGKVTVALAPDAEQTVGVLPKAPTSEKVFFDVFAEDQFANLTADSVVVDDNGSPAYINDGSGSDTVTSQFLGDNAAVEATSDVATNQTLTATWTQASNTWTDGNTVLAGFQATRKTDATKSVSDTSETVQWYVINYAASVFTLGQEGAESNRVGTTVTEVYKAVDQNGEPIAGIDVRFFRSGPDDLQDGDGNSIDTTDANGEAFYTFQGAKAGTAEITAVPYFDYNPTTGAGDRIPGGSRTDTVSFSNAAANRVAIEALLRLSNQADGDDVARVNAPSRAAGAMVKLFKVKKDGTRVLLATKTANANGNAKFVVNDTNGNRYTSYKAKVVRTSDTFADWTPKKRIR